MRLLKNEYEIKANERLFDEIKELTERMKETLPSTVQNDMKLSKHEIVEFFDICEKYIDKFDDWIRKIQKHITKIKKEENDKNGRKN